MDGLDYGNGMHLVMKTQAGLQEVTYLQSFFTFSPSRGYAKRCTQNEAEFLADMLNKATIDSDKILGISYEVVNLYEDYKRIS